MVRLKSGFFGGFPAYPNEGAVYYGTNHVILEPNDVEDVYDIKTSLNGQMTVDQKTRLSNVLNMGGGDREARIATTHRRWTTTRGWHDNIYFKNGVRVFAAFGIASSLYAICVFDESYPLLTKMVDEARKVQRGDGFGATPQEQMFYWLNNDVRPFLQQFDPDGLTTNVAIAGAMRHALQDFE